MAKQIFMLHQCDEWKSTNTSSVILVTTSQRKLKSAIVKCIEKKEMQYSDGREDLSVRKQIALFKEDWKEKTSREINDRLTFGWYDYAYDGEFI